MIIGKANNMGQKIHSEEKQTKQLKHKIEHVIIKKHIRNKD